MKSEGLNRRRFLGLALAGLGAAALASIPFWGIRRKQKGIEGELLGPNHQAGHLLRESQNLQMSRELKTGVLIAGGGIAGLSCAWRLRKRGFHDFLLIEMEEYLGGNSHSGSKNGLKYPWGAHYLPVPDPSNVPLVEFLREHNIIKGQDANGKLIFDEMMLCHSPQERLRIHGKWQNGLVPETGISEDEKSQMARFFQDIEDWKQRSGKDGKRAFAIPAEHSSNEAEWRALDQITMAEYLRRNEWNSPHLRWYVNYCCRDDYGMTMHECSAWAGLHYFASRTGAAANADSGAVLTWEQGNGYLVECLRQGLNPDQVMQNTMACRMESALHGVETKALGLPNEGIRIHSRVAVFAGPQFVAGRIIPGREKIGQGFTYAPWLVANIHLDLTADEELGKRFFEQLAWDNVGHDAPQSLGYVHAGHQKTRAFTPDSTVLTWYMPMSDKEPRLARETMLATDIQYWQGWVLEDLQWISPQIIRLITRIDVWQWGHGMVRPVPGLITGKLLEEARQPQGNIHFAHSDLSGFSIFEEAFHRGVKAADAVLAGLS